MTLADLFEMLDMDTPADFEYFEQFADLMESEEDIPFDLFYSVISEASPETMTELTGNYMEDLSNALPDDYDDLFTIVDSVQQRLLLLCENLDDSDSRRDYANELYRFRQWFHKEDGAFVDGKPCCVMDAAARARSEKFSGTEHVYDFSPSLGYELEDLSVGLGSFREINLVESEEPEEEEDSIIEESDAELN
ncbi:MAG: hypothetical protein MJ194_06435 [Clostridia bacterium]|nr:hypothetical protein [Clostridia bacterium]